VVFHPSDIHNNKKHFHISNFRFSIRNHQIMAHHTDGQISNIQHCMYVWKFSRYIILKDFAVNIATVKMKSVKISWHIKIVSNVLN